MPDNIIETTTVRKKTLLEKYGIPVNHLDFDYISKCSNLKEIERITKVLRSNEEGYYPDLQACAENKLKELSPNHPLLRINQPALTSDSLEPSEYQNIVTDMQEWKKTIEHQETEINLEKMKMKKKKTYPSIRTNKALTNKQNEQKKDDKIKSLEYEKWDQYDAEEECLKIDLEAEKNEEQRILKEKQNAARKKILKAKEDIWINEVKECSANMTITEKEILSNKEKQLGNEFYKVQDYQNAIRYYTRSIAINPFAPATYNNRAATYLKMEQYTKVIEDATKVLNLEPENEKALYRRALALKQTKNYKQALRDTEKILKVNPNNLYAKELCGKIKSLIEPDNFIANNKYQEENEINLEKLQFTNIEKNLKQLVKVEEICKDDEKNFTDGKRLKILEMETLNEEDKKDTTRITSDKILNVDGFENTQTIAKDNLDENNKKRDSMSNNDNIVFKKGKRLKIVEVESLEESEKSVTFINEISLANTNPHSSNPQDTVTNKDINISNENNTKITTGNIILKNNINDITNPEKYSKIKAKTVTDEENKLKVDDSKKDILKITNVDPVKQLIKLNGNLEKDNFENVTQQNYKVNNNNKMKTEELKLNENIKENSENFNFLEPEKEEKSKSIQIAEKYRNKTSKNSDLESEEAKPKTLNIQIQHFIRNWQKLNLKNSDLSEKALLFRSVKPQHLPAAVGQLLDDELLTDFLKCLKFYFHYPEEIHLVNKYLIEISKLDEFKIIVSFLSDEIMSIVQELLLKLGTAADITLEKLYFNP